MKKMPFACLLLVVSTVSSQSATLNFTGAALATCTLITPVDGALTLGADLQSWATLTPAAITAVNTAPSTVTVTSPTSWSLSPAGTPTTTFAVSGSMSGANAGTLSGTADARTGALTAIGATIVSVSLAATATAPFRAGLHSAQVTVTCAVP